MQLYKIVPRPNSSMTDFPLNLTVDQQNWIWLKTETRAELNCSTKMSIRTWSQWNTNLSHSACSVTKFWYFKLFCYLITLDSAHQFRFSSCILSKVMDSQPSWTRMKYFWPRLVLPLYWRLPYKEKTEWLICREHLISNTSQSTSI